MSTQDDKFIEQLRATFQVEAQEHLQGISSMLLDLEKALPDAPADTIENIYRAAHSLKGAARSVAFRDIETICQAVESVFHGWKQKRSVPTPKAFDTLHHAVDTIRTIMADPGGSQQRINEELVQRLDRIRIGGPPPRPAVPVVSVPPSRTPEAIQSSPAPAPPPMPAPASTTGHAPPTSPVRVESAQTVRVALDTLDARLLQAEDMLTVKAMSAQQLNDLRELAPRFERWRAEWAAVAAEARALRQTLDQTAAAGNPSSGAHASASAALIRFIEWNQNYMRSLEDQLATLTSRASSAHHSVSRRVDDLLQDSKKMLMLPFQTLAESFPLLVRDLGREQEKEVELVVRGGDIQIDKRILEEMKDPFIHILRNCIDHGLEKPGRREQLGKPARATITIAVSRIRSDTVELIVSDDGSGVNIEALKNSAVRQGIIPEPDARKLTTAEALELMFRSGVSTSPIITSISGRGLGMAIAHARTEKLGGRITVQSVAGAGTTFRIELPLTLATFRGILVKAGDGVYLVPTANIERVTRVRPADIQSVENRLSILLDGRPISLVPLAGTLGGKVRPLGGNDSTPMPVAVLQAAEQKVGFLVDEVLHEEEVLVKPLPRPLGHIRHISGATVLGSGRVVTVLNVVELIESARTSSAPIPASGPDGTQKAERKRVLVVEDSITSRMLLKGILEGAGYRVRIAVDGMDAFTILREETFDLVVSDVEMPRMNGLHLTSRIRAEKRLADLPVVLVTALESRDERERGIDAGANAYIVKSSFDQSNLLHVVQQLI